MIYIFFNHGDYVGPYTSCDQGQGFAAADNNDFNSSKVGNGNNEAQNNYNFQMKAFPNPATSKVNIIIKSSEYNTQLVISDINGKTVWQQEIEVGQTSLDVDISNNKYGAGIYFITAYNKNGMESQRLIIRK